MVTSSRSRSARRAGIALVAVAALGLTAACSSDADPAAAPTAPASETASAPATTAPATSSSASATASPRKTKTAKASATASAEASPTATSSPTRTRTKTPEPAPTRTKQKTKKPTKPAGPSITLSISEGLDPDKQTVVVRGKGFDTSTGLYVALCLKPAAGQAPTPCGGGVDTSGTSGASGWISSNPPPYGKSLAKPFGPGGTFKVTLVVSARINDTVDCRKKKCVIGTRADHTRSSDRSVDFFVPVTFKKK
jgi:hypothetical protein